MAFLKIVWNAEKVKNDYHHHLWQRNSKMFQIFQNSKYRQKKEAQACHNPLKKNRKLKNGMQICILINKETSNTRLFVKQECKIFSNVMHFSLKQLRNKNWLTTKFASMTCQGQSNDDNKNNNNIVFKNLHCSIKPPNDLI